jgi:LEA14-like dessication related protein
VVRITPRGRRSPTALGTTVLCLVLAASFSGCALFKRFSFESPTVRLEFIEVTRLDFEGGALRLQLAVYNPNPYDLRGGRLSATLDLEGTHFGEAAFDREAKLTAGEQNWVTVPIEFTWQGVGAAARGVLTRGAVAYRLEGRLLVHTPSGERWVPLELTGDVGVREMFGDR